MDGHAFGHAAPELKEDRVEAEDVTLGAANQNGHAHDHAAPAQNGKALQVAAPKHKKPSRPTPKRR